MNDSPFYLNAEVIAFDGTMQGKIGIGAQHQAVWQSAEGQTDWSQTPYTVVFTCKDGKQFGVFVGAQQGATVNALSSSGARYCDPDKKEGNNGSQANKPQNPSPSAGDFLEDTTIDGEKSNDADPDSSPGDPIWGPP